MLLVHKKTTLHNVYKTFACMYYYVRSMLILLLETFRWEIKSSKGTPQSVTHIRGQKNYASLFFNDGYPKLDSLSSRTLADKKTNTDIKLSRSY